MGHKTPLYDAHVEAGGKMVEFAGWDMPLNYGSQLEEHHAVRTDAGMFDVSHMVVTDFKGGNVADMLRLLLANDVERIRNTPGKALYTCMLNSEGHILDDLIVYYLDDHWYRIVSNAATREKDLAWFKHAAEDMGDVNVIERTDLAIIAVQGPNAKAKTRQALGEGLREVTEPLKPFCSASVGELFVATTGYTGEAGFEIILPGKAAAFTWKMLLENGVRPCGLGARDSLRLEAGMALYGSDMDETTTPLESGLAWTISFDEESRRFIGRDALEKQKESGDHQQLVGLIFTGKGVLRRHQIVSFGNHGQGEITSGGFSPTLQHSVALAHAPAGVKAGMECEVNLRGKMVQAEVVKYPFVRNGQPCFKKS